MRTLMTGKRFVEEVAETQGFDVKFSEEEL